MRVSRDAMLGQLSKFLGSSFWHPGDLGSRSQLQNATPVYVPYWVYSADAHTFYTGDSSHTPYSARGDWYPVSGEHRERYKGVLITASRVLRHEETSGLLPFDLSKAQPASSVDLENVTTEEFRMPRKASRPLARDAFDAIERRTCTSLIPGKARNVNVNVMLHNLSSEPMLLPVWVLAYRYRKQVYRVLINGQTGKLIGQAPTSYLKLFAVIGGIVLLIFLVLLLIAANG